MGSFGLPPPNLFPSDIMIIEIPRHPELLADIVVHFDPDRPRSQLLASQNADRPRGFDGTTLVADGAVEAAGVTDNNRPLAVMLPAPGLCTSYLVMGTYDTPTLCSPCLTTASSTVHRHRTHIHWRGRRWCHWQWVLLLTHPAPPSQCVTMHLWQCKFYRSSCLACLR